MRNPLMKRIPRELKSDFGKYLVIFILMILTIGLISGYLVAANSLISAYNEGFEKYNVEDGKFETTEIMNKAQFKNVSALGVSLYEMFCFNVSLSNDSTMRIYAKRSEVNIECLMEGSLPENPGEIAIDRMYADNNLLCVGDEIESADGKRKWTVCGFVALPDYSCLYENNSDAMFDASSFGVGVVSEEEFDGYDKELLNYWYSWKYDDAPADDDEAKEMSDDFLDSLNEEVSLEDYVPAYMNLAITFTGDDFGGDKVMMEVLLYIIMAIIAFVFAVTVSNTISKEAAVIGTLRASGYTKGELIRHYMMMPLTVTLISAAIGNIWGYTQMKNFVAGLYYDSYSLPTYETLWNAEAFLKTTLAPVVIMILINYIVLKSRLGIMPIKFLRRELSKKRMKKALRLPHGLPFFQRFRLRVIFQNIPNYIVMFFGIFLAEFLLIFSIGLPPLLENFQENIAENVFCEYQYILKMPAGITDENHKLESMISLIQFYDEVETENEDAEKFSVYTLKTPEDTDYKQEDVMIYGIEEGSSYIDADLKEGDVYLSYAMAEKYGLSEGDGVTLTEAYDDDEYTFTVTGVYDYEGAVCMFMNIDYLNEYFELGDGFFCGYLSASEITDIDEEYIGQVITVDSLTKISRQLLLSFGDMVDLINVFALIIFVVIIYLLSKIIIEKNAQSISMAKIMGYLNREIAILYIIPTSVVVAAFTALAIYITSLLMSMVFEAMLMERMTGWIAIVIEKETYLKAYFLGIATYGVVALLEFRRIRKVPMEEALKNVE